MQKNLIMELLNIYHWRENEKTSSINPWFYRKGWLKRLLHTRTRGVAELEQFLEREEIKALSPEEEITGENLKGFLYLLEARQSRINETERDYKKQPDKSTNRIYQRLYDLLLFDTLSENESILPSVEYCVQVLFAHYTSLVLWEIEKRALTGETFDTPDGSILFSSQLAKALTTGEVHTFNFSQLIAPSEGTQNTKVLQFENQQIEVSFQFIDGQLSTIKLEQAKIALKKNLQERIKWLHLSSYQGDSAASYELAEHYGKSYNSSFIYNAVDGIRSWRYLRMAQQQDPSRVNSGGYEEELIEFAQQQDIHSLIKNNEETHELTQRVINLREATEEVSQATQTATHDIVEAAVTITLEAERFKTTAQQVGDETSESLEALRVVTSELAQKKDELDAALDSLHSESNESVAVYSSGQLTLISNELLLTQQELAAMKQQLMDYMEAFNKLFQENEANKKMRKECVDLIKKYEKILKEKTSESPQSTLFSSPKRDIQSYHPKFWSPGSNNLAIKRSTSCPNLIINL